MIFDFDTNKLSEKTLKDEFSSHLLESSDSLNENNKELTNYVIKELKDSNIRSLDSFLVKENCIFKAEQYILENNPKKVWIDVIVNNKIKESLIFENLSWSAVKSPTVSINPGHSISLEEGLDYNETHQNLVNNFLEYCKEYLEIDIPNISLLSERTESITTGSYDPNTHDICAYAKNRALVDVLRTIAHELVHHQQNLQNRLVGDIPEVGGEIEDEANAIAGRIIKSFGKNPQNSLMYEI